LKAIAPGQPFIILHLFHGSTDRASNYYRAHGAGEQSQPVPGPHYRVPEFISAKRNLRGQRVAEGYRIDRARHQATVEKDVAHRLGLDPKVSDYLAQRSPCASGQIYRRTGRLIPGIMMSQFAK
jgi:hypothetical protein